VGAAAGGWGKWLLKARLEQLSRSATYTAWAKITNQNLNELGDWRHIILQ
jgi:hypothetical protein